MSDRVLRDDRWMTQDEAEAYDREYDRFIDRDAQLKLLRRGREGVAKWNRFNARRYQHQPFGNESFDELELPSVDFRSRHLEHSTFRAAYLAGARLDSSVCKNVDFSGANLIGAHFSGAQLDGARFCDAKLHSAFMVPRSTLGTDFADAVFAFTVVGGDLSGAINLEHVLHVGPSLVSTDTFVRSRGRIPPAFLKGCGLQDWEIATVKLYDPALDARQICDVQQVIFDLRANKPILVGGVFICYSHDDAEFVDKLEIRLDREGVRVWRDKHDLVAGNIDEQILSGLRLSGAVIVVLSESSVKSRWVDHEIRTTCEREEEEHRTILCPVSLDDAWKEMKGVDWTQLRKKYVVDFSKWKTGAFEDPFKNLRRGLRLNYAPENMDAAE